MATLSYLGGDFGVLSPVGMKGRGCCAGVSQTRAGKESPLRPQVAAARRSSFLTSRDILMQQANM